MLFTFPMFVFQVAVLLFLIWLLALSVLVLNIWKHYNRLTRGAVKKDLKSVLEGILSQTQVSAEEIKKIKVSIGQLEKEGKFHIQQVGLLRYNPFGDTGGDQSFVLTLLDGQQNGVIISSLHSRSATRWYAKKIKAGKGQDYELSQEEERAIKLAQKP